MWPRQGALPSEEGAVRRGEVPLTIFERTAISDSTQSGVSIPPKHLNLCNTVASLDCCLNFIE